MPVPCARRAAAVALAAVTSLILAGCGHSAPPARAYGALRATLGQTVALLGWNVSVANLRFAAGRALVDVEAAAVADLTPGRANPADLRFGLYGSLAHPIEATGRGSCDELLDPSVHPLSAPSPDRLTGTVCLGPISDQAQVRGVYAYSPRDRIAGSTVAYPAAFPVGLPPTNPGDSGLTLNTTSVEAWQADGTQLSPASLGDATTFTGKGYMLLGLRVDAPAAQYRDDSAARGGPMMLVAAPTLPPPGLNPACSAYGGSVLLLPDVALDAVQVAASLCTQGEINAALFYATVSVAGTHAAVWTEAAP